MATYACLAIAQVKQETTSTVMFAEWLGEVNFNMKSPINALTWAKSTTAWMIPNKCEQFGNINMDTSEMKKNNNATLWKIAVGNNPTTKTRIWSILNDEMLVEEDIQG